MSNYFMGYELAPWTAQAEDDIEDALSNNKQFIEFDISLNFDDVTLLASENADAEKYNSILAKISCNKKISDDEYKFMAFYLDECIQSISEKYGERLAKRRIERSIADMEIQERGYVQ